MFQLCEGSLCLESCHELFAAFKSELEQKFALLVEDLARSGEFWMMKVVA